MSHGSYKDAIRAFMRDSSDKRSRDPEHVMRESMRDEPSNNYARSVLVRECFGKGGRPSSSYSSDDRGREGSQKDHSSQDSRRGRDDSSLSSISSSSSSSSSRSRSRSEERRAEQAAIARRVPGATQGGYSSSSSPSSSSSRSSSSSSSNSSSSSSSSSRSPGSSFSEGDQPFRYLHPDLEQKHFRKMSGNISDPENVSQEKLKKLAQQDTRLDDEGGGDVSTMFYPNKAARKGLKKAVKVGQTNLRGYGTANYAPDSKKGEIVKYVHQQVEGQQPNHIGQTKVSYGSMTNIPLSHMDPKQKNYFPVKYKGNTVPNHYKNQGSKFEQSKLHNPFYLEDK